MDWATLTTGAVPTRSWFLVASDGWAPGFVLTSQGHQTASGGRLAGRRIWQRLHFLLCQWDGSVAWKGLNPWPSLLLHGDWSACVYTCYGMYQYDMTALNKQEGTTHTNPKTKQLFLFHLFPSLGFFPPGFRDHLSLTLLSLQRATITGMSHCVQH